MGTRTIPCEERIPIASVVLIICLLGVAGCTMGPWVHDGGRVPTAHRELLLPAELRCSALRCAEPGGARSPRPRRPRPAQASAPPPGRSGQVRAERPHK